MVGSIERYAALSTPFVADGTVQNSDLTVSTIADPDFLPPIIVGIDHIAPVDRANLNEFTAPDSRYLMIQINWNNVLADRDSFKQKVTVKQLLTMYKGLT